MIPVPCLVLPNGSKPDGMRVTLVDLVRLSVHVAGFLQDGCKSIQEWNPARRTSHVQKECSLLADWVQRARKARTYSICKSVRWSSSRCTAPSRWGIQAHGCPSRWVSGPFRILMYSIDCIAGRDVYHLLATLHNKFGHGQFAPMRSSRARAILP